MKCRNKKQIDWEYKTCIYDENFETYWIHICDNVPIISYNESYGTNTSYEFYYKEVLKNGTTVMDNDIIRSDPNKAIELIEKYVGFSYNAIENNLISKINKKFRLKMINGIFKRIKQLYPNFLYLLVSSDIRSVRDIVKRYL